MTLLYLLFEMVDWLTFLDFVERFENVLISILKNCRSCRVFFSKLSFYSSFAVFSEELVESLKFHSKSAVFRFTKKKYL